MRADWKVAKSKNIKLSFVPGRVYLPRTYVEHRNIESKYLLLQKQPFLGHKVSADLAFKW